MTSSALTVYLIRPISYPVKVASLKGMSTALMLMALLRTNVYDIACLLIWHCHLAALVWHWLFGIACSALPLSIAYLFSKVRVVNDVQVIYGDRIDNDVRIDSPNQTPIKPQLMQKWRLIHLNTETHRKLHNISKIHSFRFANLPSGIQRKL